MKKDKDTKQAKRKKEFSKIMAVISITMWVIVNIFGLVMVAFTMDASPLAYVIPSVDAVVGVVLTAYYAKAKLENQIKLKRLYGDGVMNDCDNGVY